MKKNISVSEYAKLKGISQQAVYKQIVKRKVEYVEKVENGRNVKYIVLDVEQVEQPIQSSLTTDEQPIQPAESEFQTVIRLLQSQLEEKDRQIARLQEQYAIQADECRVKDQTIKEALEKAQTLQAQVNLLLLESKKPDEPEEEILQSTVSDVSKDEVKKGFWARLFNL